MKLVITSSTEEFSGTYKVVVSNEAGKDESSTTVTVKVIYVISIMLKIHTKTISLVIIYNLLELKLLLT